MDIILRALLILVLLLIGSVVLAALNARYRTTIFEYERGLRFRRGRFDRVLPAGVYWSWSPSVRIDKVDVRPTRVAIAGQEVLTADGVAVKGSLVATYQVVEPERVLVASDDFRAAVYSELQLALRVAVTELPVDQLLQQRADLPARLKALASDKIRALGVELIDASVRDFTFPGELKKIFTQVVKARQEGLAALEKARGETAALRNLANAAQMVERNPNLLQLRLLQVLAQQPGNTVVMGIQQGSTPIPVRGATAAPDLPPPGDESAPS
jgi:regulator of protease activity HflC (stomatin/prohibitin superfamily)